MVGALIGARLRAVERKVTLYEVDEGVALVTLNRPDRLNAWTARMELEYRDALVEADGDPDVRVVVVTGAGRGFCAGADAEALTGIVETGRYGSRSVVGGVEEKATEEKAAVGSAGDHRYGIRPDFEHAFSSPYGLRKPVIAAINGPAAGVGFVLACFADIRFAASGVKLTTAAPKLGFPAEYGLSWLLPRLIGAGRAADWLLSGRIFLSDEAADVGLFSAVVPATELAAHVDQYARTMARHVSPASVAATKAQLWGDLLHLHPARSVRESMTLLRTMATGADFAEGAAALSEGRQPEF